MGDILRRLPGRPSADLTMEQGSAQAMAKPRKSKHEVVVGAFVRYSVLTVS